jgi:hypothetical protein
MILLDASTASPGEIIAGLFFILVGAVLALGIYFLPSLIAYKRHLDHFRRILILNILLGWTLIVWVNLMFWVTNLRRSTPPVGGVVVAPASGLGQLSPDGRWRWDGQRWLPTA